MTEIQSGVISTKNQKNYELSDDDEAIEPETQPLVNLFSFGWLEDGRCGYPPENSVQLSQLSPKPISSLRVSEPKRNKPMPVKYITRNVSCGSRHTLIILAKCRDKEKEIKRTEEEQFDYDMEKHEPVILPRRAKKILISGLNQSGLCEEEGYENFTEVRWDCEADPPVSCKAGNGCSFFTTKRGLLVSFGLNKFGVLGHGKNEETDQMPRVVDALRRLIVRKVATGAAHTMALTDDGELFSWGKNDKGQLGRGFESDMELVPAVVLFSNLSKAEVFDVDCGQEHTIAHVGAIGAKGLTTSTVYCWGDESQGQLGSGDAVSRSRPQENRWLTRFMRKNQIHVERVVCGGYHNLVLIRYSGQVISWGGGTYGQLGSGFQWNDPNPRIINNLKDVKYLSAGLRHSLAVCHSHSIDVFGWGSNAFGELGLGDVDIRLQPTKITAIKSTKVFGVSCGARHSMVITAYKPLTVKEDVQLKPYFKILEAENNSRVIERRLKNNMVKQGLDPELLGNPDMIMPNQPGINDYPLKNEPFAQGLRYCFDTKCDSFDWRRKALEACYEVRLKGGLVLKTVCLSCARNCLASYRLRPYIRNRSVGDKCDCKLSGQCVSRYNNIRAFFDKVATDDDNNIGPGQIKNLLKMCRAPYPVDSADVIDCCLSLAEGKDEGRFPRILPVPFEKWYRKYYDEREEEEDGANDYDKDGSGSMSIDEIDGMIRDIYGKKATTDAHAKAISHDLHKMTKKKDIDVHAFCQFVKSHHHFLFPAFELQMKLQDSTLGKSFWKRNADRRVLMSDGKYISVAELMKKQT